MSETNDLSLEKFAEACNYPGVIDDAAVEVSLGSYLKALGVTRKIKRLTWDWSLNDDDIRSAVLWTLDDFCKRRGINGTARDAHAALDASDAHDALAARDAHAALDARAARDDSKKISALLRFSRWVIQSRGWWSWSWDISWIATIALGARQLKKDGVSGWSVPLYKAFLSGAWFLFWTENTLFWIAKPRMHFEQFEGARNNRRLHNAKYAAIESDAENFYYWHGVEVPAFVVTRPDWITIKHIETESNAEIRRVMIERYGQERFIDDAGATEIHRDDFGILFRKDLAGDEPMIMVKVVNSTAEPDGSFKDYFLRVPPTVKTAKEAVAWSFDLPVDSYELAQQT